MEDQQFGIKGFGEVYRKIKRLAGLCRAIVRDDDLSNHVIFLRLANTRKATRAWDNNDLVFATVLDGMSAMPVWCSGVRLTRRR